MRKEVGGIQGVVSDEFKRLAMPVVRTTLCSHTDYPIRSKSILGIEIVGQHTKFLRSVRIGKRIRGLKVVVHVLDAVEHVEHTAHAAAVDFSRSLGGHAAARSGSGKVRLRSVRCSRRQEGKGSRIATI